MKNIKISTTTILLFILIFTQIIFSQNKRSVILPIPQIGWDSLQNKISYPEIARRASLWGAYEASIIIDSLGQMINCKINYANYEKCDFKDSLFIKWIEYEFRDLKWNPGLVNNKPTTMKITIPMVFYFRDWIEASPTLFIKSTVLNKTIH